MRRLVTSTLRGLAALSLCAALLAACANPPLVVQGTVVAHDETKHAITVRDERPPNATVELLIAHAEIGAQPQAGDLVRLAYREKDGVKAATRLMNLTRQTELKKAGGGH